MIENLPPEVRSLILEYLAVCVDWAFSERLHNDAYSNQPWNWEERESYTALNGVSRASRHLHALATPELYRTLIVDDLSDPLRLITTLSQNPHLGGLVRELHLHLDIAGQPYSLEVRAQIRQLFIAASPRLELPPETESGMCNGLGTRNLEVLEDATVAFWLTLMPNIRALTLSIPSTPFLTAGLFAEGNSRKRFPLLQETRLEPAGSEGFGNRQIVIGFLGGVFSLPSIKTIHFHHVLWRNLISREDYLLPDISCKLENLQLVAVDISYTALDTLLSRCHNLRVLNCDLLVFAHGFSCGRLGDILRAHGEILEVLDLNSRPAIHSVKEVEELLFGRIGSLRSLPRLTEIIGPLHALIGLDETNIGSKKKYFNPQGPLPKSEKPCLRLVDVLPDSLERMQFSVLLPGKDLEKDLHGVTECKRLSRLEWIHCMDCDTISNFPKNFKCPGWVSNGHGTIERVERMDDDPSKASAGGTAN